MAQKIVTVPPVRNPPYPGGTPNTPSSGGGAAATSVNIPTSNGGVFAKQQISIFPCLNVNNNRIEYRAFDTTLGFNDPNSASTYSWRYEQIKPYRQATVRRLLLTYRDIGQVAVIFTITGSTDNGKVVKNSTAIGFGNATPTNRLLTTPVDILLTALNPQLSVTRAANAGPLSIVQVVMVGEVEDVTL